jgi:hypothetical protein
VAGWSSRVGPCRRSASRRARIASTRSDRVSLTAPRCRAQRMLVQLLICSTGITIGVFAGGALHSALAGMLVGICIPSGAAYVVLP